MYAGGANFTSLLFRNVYRIYIFIVWFVFRPFIDELIKRERSIWRVYICMFISFPCFCKKRNEFGEFMHICVVWFMPFIEYFYLYCYAWVKGDLLWSLFLIHAYITPWVLSSSKKGRLLAQRPITLVLIMINSCSYSTNDLVFN